MAASRSDELHEKSSEVALSKEELRRIYIQGIRASNKLNYAHAVNIWCKSAAEGHLPSLLALAREYVTPREVCAVGGSIPPRLKWTDEEINIVKERLIDAAKNQSSGEAAYLASQLEKTEAKKAELLQLAKSSPNPSYRLLSKEEKVLNLKKNSEEGDLQLLPELAHCYDRGVDTEKNSRKTYESYKAYEMALGRSTEGIQTCEGYLNRFRSYYQSCFVYAARCKKEESKEEIIKEFLKEDVCRVLIEDKSIIIKDLIRIFRGKINPATQEFMRSKLLELGYKGQLKLEQKPSGGLSSIIGLLGRRVTRLEELPTADSGPNKRIRFSNSSIS